MLHASPRSLLFTGLRKTPAQLDYVRHKVLHMLGRAMSDELWEALQARSGYERTSRQRAPRAQPNIQPPSTSSVCPVTKLESSLAKKAIARATSSTSPRRLID
jgi:hypothetical protein